MCCCICDFHKPRPADVAPFFNLSQVGTVKRRSFTGYTNISPDGRFLVRTQTVSSVTTLYVAEIAFENDPNSGERLPVAITSYVLSFNAGSSQPFFFLGCSDPAIVFITATSGSIYAVNVETGVEIGNFVVPTGSYQSVETRAQNWANYIDGSTAFVRSFNWTQIDMLAAAASAASINVYPGPVGLHAITADCHSLDGESIIALYWSSAASSTSEPPRTIEVMQINRDGSYSWLTNQITLDIIGPSISLGSTNRSYVDSDAIYWAHSIQERSFSVGVRYFRWEFGSSTLTEVAGLGAAVLNPGFPTSRHSWLGNYWWASHRPGLLLTSRQSGGTWYAIKDGTEVTMPASSFDDDGCFSMATVTANGISDRVYRKHDIRDDDYDETIVLSTASGDVLPSVNGITLIADRYLHTFSSSPSQFQSFSEE